MIATTVASAALTEALVRQLAAICERILPPDGNGPSASDAHVVEFILSQLETPWASGAGMYREPPFVQAEHGGHGWQSPLTPLEVYRHGLEALAARTREQHGCEFPDLAPAAQDDLIGELETGEIPTFTAVSAREFLELVRRNTVEALFSDPSYGGNHEMVGWRWLGYPGVASAHGDAYRRHISGPGRPFTAEPRPLDWSDG